MAAALSLDPVEEDLHGGVAAREDIATAVLIDARERLGEEQARARRAAVEVDLGALVGARVVDRVGEVEPVAAGDVAAPGAVARGRRVAAHNVVRPDLVLKV